MADNREAKFLDALYLGAKDGGLFDRAMGMLADQFDCASAFSPARTISSEGLISSLTPRSA
jgi:hypothetical protein